MSEDTMTEMEKLKGYFKQGSLVILMLLILMTSFQFYFALNDAIYTWFEYEYVSLIRALYNLAILAVCLYVVVRYYVRK
ncbi:hypothetical protein J2755_001545 [Methanohalophilus levihalophilus]|uniref:hypothetical protein n=1 Tax=Methanohalophilus levihalophilus TaxID=1431282 RepID=UPI001AE68445|nr:hypothetical protein [Methanohalophilus levihalophilus]MBP2030597.1 hypothetical protein [Methanohalophilus levihalophilus]